MYQKKFINLKCVFKLNCLIFSKKNFFFKENVFLTVQLLLIIKKKKHFLYSFENFTFIIPMGCYFTLLNTWHFLFICSFALYTSSQFLKCTGWQLLKYKYKACPYVIFIWNNDWVLGYLPQRGRKYQQFYLIQWFWFLNSEFNLNLNASYLVFGELLL